MWIVLFAAVFFGQLAHGHRPPPAALPSWVLNCAALAYLPFFIWDARILSRSFVIAAIHLLIFAAAVKLLTLSKDRDYLQLYLISLAQILAASILTVNMIFAICLLAFIVSGTSTIVLFEMRRSNAKMQAAAKVQPFVTQQRKSRKPEWSSFRPFPPDFSSCRQSG